MEHIARTFDRVAASYDADPMHILDGNHQAWDEQTRRCLAFDEGARVLDLAAGTGGPLARLQADRPGMSLAAVDISSGMLELARKRLGTELSTFCTDAVSAPDHLPQGSFDLVLCHFILSYVQPEHVLEAAAKLVAPGGYLSIITSTNDQFNDFLEGPLAGILKWSGAARKMRNTTTPKTHQHCIQLVEQAGFEVRDELPRVHHLSMDSDALWDASINAGWIAGEFASWPAPALRLLKGGLHMIEVMRPGWFPVEMCARFSIILAQKPAGPNDSPGMGNERLVRWVGQDVREQNIA